MGGGQHTVQGLKIVLQGPDEAYSTTRVPSSLQAPPQLRERERLILALKITLCPQRSEILLYFMSPPVPFGYPTCPQILKAGNQRVQRAFKVRSWGGLQEGTWPSKVHRHLWVALSWTRTSTLGQRYNGIRYTILSPQESTLS